MNETLTEAFDRAATDTPTKRIVTAVADATGVDVLDLPPLYDAVDPEALGALVEHADADDTLRVEFRFAGCVVTVRGDGSVAARLVDTEQVDASVADGSLAGNC
jgi:hypothetical protein